MTTTPSQFSRRQFLQLAGVIGAGLSISGCSVASDDSGSSTAEASTSAATAASFKYGKVDIPGKGGSLCNAPCYIAYDKGFFADEGFDVNLITADTETRKIGLNNGTIPIVNGDFQFFPSIEEGVQAKVVDGLHNGCIKLEVLPDSDIKEAEDLRGKKVGVDEIGGTPHQVTALWLEAHGISASSSGGEVTFLPFEDTNLEFEALQSGQIDAAAIWDPVGALKEKSGEARVILDISTDPQFKGRYCCFLYGSTSWLNEDEERAAALLRGYHKAQDWISKNTAEAAKIIADKQYSAITDTDFATELLTSYEYPSLEERAAGNHKVLDDVKYFSEQLSSIGYLKTQDPDGFAESITKVLDTGDEKA